MRKCLEHAVRIARVVIDTDEESFCEEEEEEDCNDSLYSEDDQDYTESFETGHMARSVKRTRKTDNGNEDAPREAKRGRTRTPLRKVPLEPTWRDYIQCHGGKEQEGRMLAVYTHNKRCFGMTNEHQSWRNARMNDKQVWGNALGTLSH